MAVSILMQIPVVPAIGQGALVEMEQLGKEHRAAHGGDSGPEEVLIHGAIPAL